MRSFTSFGSLDKSFILNRGSERLNYSKVTKGSFIGRVLERASLASKVIMRSSTSFGSLDKPSIVSYSL
jgi:hypothetical protein